MRMITNARLVIKVIIHQNYHSLWNSRLAYMKYCRCVACNGLSHSQYQTIRTQREQFCSHLLPDPRGVCFLSCFASDVGSCSVPAKIHERGNHRTPFCNHPRCGWNQQCYIVSSGSLSILHQLSFGHNTHQRHLNHQGRLYKHHLWFGRTCKAQHSS